jgi:hypothetical protein
MLKMQSTNVEPVLKNKYLQCNKRTNKPRLNYLVCEARCKKYKACHEYGEWYFKYYGKEIENPKKKTRKKRRKNEHNMVCIGNDSMFIFT